ncbi:MAG: c-type cytochrome [Isosphaeraceae bacterium]
MAYGVDPAPGVIAAWANGRFEARVAFDSPVAPVEVERAVGRVIAFDETRPTTHSRPGPNAADAPDVRGSLKVAAARVEDGGRTVVLTTDPHPRAGTYTLELAGQKVEYDLSGAEVTWDDGGENARPLGVTWWPSLDAAEVRSLAAKTPALAESIARLSRPGRLTVSTLVSLPKRPVTLRVASNLQVTPTLDGQEPTERDAKGASVFQTEATGDLALLVLEIRTGSAPAGSAPEWSVTITGENGPVTGRETLQLPWASAAPGALAPSQGVPDLSGGDPKRGAEVFANAESKCAQCHKVAGQGGEVGPDLTALSGRDRAEVYRDIAEPSARIHPDYVPYTVALKDGRVLVGTVRAVGAGSIRVTDTEAKSTVVERAELEDVRPSATSIMPVGLAGVIGEAKLKDLIAFLTAPRPAAAPGRGGP